MSALVTLDSTMVTLKDGSQVPTNTYTTTYGNLSGLVKERINYIALFDLVQRCFNDSSTFDEDSKRILQKHKLLQNDTLDPDVKKIVLNSIDGPAVSFKLVSPLRSKQIL